MNNSRFLLCGLSRLTVRVAHALRVGNADVVVLRRGEGDEFLSALADGVRVVNVGTRDIGEVLRAEDAAGAAGLLALSEDDWDNLRALAAARAVAPSVPLVLRTFDPALADVAEDGMGVRRAFSVSALAAPSFLAAATGADVIESLRLGDTDVPLCCVAVAENSPLVGLNAASCKARLHCALLARADGGQWTALDAENTVPLQVGDSVLLGGLQTDILRVCCQNAGWHRTKSRVRRIRPKTPRLRTTSRLPMVAAALVAVLALSVIVFARALHLSPIDAVYFVVTTATTTGYGDISLSHAPGWVKMLGCAVMLAGGALLGIVFSHLAARATAERLDEAMEERAGRLHDHVVLAGLGTIGFRIASQLTELGVPFVVVEQADTRFALQVRVRTPVLTGDARLPDTLERTGIRDARVFIACTDSDLANIQACLHARRLHPEITTVARIFDDALAAQGPKAFGVTRAVSASAFAASAFVSAAWDENAVRTLRIGTLELRAVRYIVAVQIPLEVIQGWRNAGVRVLAFRASGAAQRPSDLTGTLSPGDELVLCGPRDAITALLIGDDLSSSAVSE